MTITLPELEIGRVRSLMEAGGFADEAAVVSAALDLLERRQQFLALVQEGIDAADRGDVLDHETVFGELQEYLATLPSDAP